MKRPWWVTFIAWPLVLAVAAVTIFWRWLRCKVDRSITRGLDGRQRERRVWVAERTLLDGMWARAMQHPHAPSVRGLAENVVDALGEIA